MKYKRTYISVIASFDPDGKIRPMEFIWSDGRKYKIDRVLDIKVSAAQKAGGMGERFTVRIHGQERYLFLEYPYTDEEHIGRWFVEEPIIAG